MDTTRRRALQAAALLGVSGASAFLSGARPASAAPILESAYRAFVPELWNEPLRAPEHSESIIIGSGFGAAVAARRLTESGSSVTILERGSQWPLDARRQIFANDVAPDGRAFWRRGGLAPLTGLPMVPTDRFGGIFDVTEHGSIDVWRAAAVGGGSLVFTGVMIAPERRFFDLLFGSTVSYDEMDSVYYPRVRSALRLSPMPDDVYAYVPFTHSRIWDAQARRAGYLPKRIDGIWNWDVVRAELSGAARPSATIGESNLGNSNGAKFDLTQNYLADAQRTTRAKIHARHEVTAVSSSTIARQERPSCAGPSRATRTSKRRCAPCTIASLTPPASEPASRSYESPTSTHRSLHTRSVARSWARQRTGMGEWPDTTASTSSTAR
ncbi:NAD(P)-binding protein [Rhodococcus sp. IEGM 1381]|uniref:NAD(P)-binding protein n=1 Tax=Rhodococcus sp. IEGM 1381 TaxID=3047085 RepID=UPI0032D57EFA